MPCGGRHLTQTAILLLARPRDTQGFRVPDALSPPLAAASPCGELPDCHGVFGGLYTTASVSVSMSCEALDPQHQVLYGAASHCEKRDASG